MYSILRTLRTSSIAAIVDRLRPLLHIDPVSVLPPEITSEIFSYLTPGTLLEASRASRAWRERTLDSRLWRQKFSSEGWGLNMDAIRRFEQESRQRRKPRSRRAETHAEQNRQKKRARAEGQQHSAMKAPPIVANQNSSAHDCPSRDQQPDGAGPVNEKSLSRQNSANDEEMFDAEALLPASSTEMQLSSQPEDLDVETDGDSLVNSSPSRLRNGVLFPRLDVEQALMRYDTSNSPQINYNHVYKQKRKLEENWESGSYQSFQLPHRNHPEEAHRECVYTIQYSGNFLVSGSRDKTLRKWNLETQRLIGKPLTGHNASVLCLQFDEREGEDLIASGSSDTDVILWQFSTGKLVHRIPHAHGESVLNLKFDSRFLVTCSKDKTIKIWNRRELRPGDVDYPVRGMEGGGICPARIIDLRDIATRVDIDRRLTAEEKAPLAPYTNIMILDTHNAAVNAIHIYEDQLVSASGDRHVHLWNIHTGVRTAICRGHTKGIACVQYDGKRIVSGSSDNTIRIFDPVTQAEVACLKGHTRLVRTIQSAFGDLPGKRDQLETEAGEIDGKYHEARLTGRIAATPSARTRDRNAGSSDPRNIMALGAKLPPGGGGSRWGRIVSGSYDETIIIWKKHPGDGRWVKAHVLRQEEALRAAGGPLPSASDLAAQAQQQALNTARAQLAREQANLAVLQNARAQAEAQADQNQNNAQQRAVGGQFGGAAQISSTVNSNGPNNSHGPARPGAHPTPNISQPHQTQVTANTSVQRTPSTASGVDNNSNSLPAPNQQRSHANNLATIYPPLVPQQPHQNHAHHHPPPPPAPQQHPLHQAQPQPPQQAHHNNGHPGPPQGLRLQNTTLSQPNARVFKLQFDARRIICCSQDPKIVGWDFANGDEKIAECSSFFATPQ